MTDPHALDALTSALDYPMFVVTAAGGGERGGCLVGFLTQCSIEPARFLVCLSRHNHTTRVVAGADVLAVHLVGRRQQPLAELFGTTTGDDTDKFDHCEWIPGPGGTPLLADCPNRFVGRILAAYDVGDHVGFLVDVVEASADRPGDFLRYHEVRHLVPGHRA